MEARSDGKGLGPGFRRPLGGPISKDPGGGGAPA